MRATRPEELYCRKFYIFPHCGKENYQKSSAYEAQHLAQPLKEGYATGYVSSVLVLKIIFLNLERYEPKQFTG